VLQDILTIDGRQFRDAEALWFSPPCTEYSYMAMPWSRGKQIAAALRGLGEFPEGYRGSRTVDELNALFNACFRIQREACEAAGRHIPLVVENVRGAQPWVGKAVFNYGSFYLWGDVPALMPTTKPRAKAPGMNWSDQTKRGQDFTRCAAAGGYKREEVSNLQNGIPVLACDDAATEQELLLQDVQRCDRGIRLDLQGESGLKVPGNNGPRKRSDREVQRLGDATKTVGHANIRDGHSHTRHLTNQRESDAVKQHGSGPIWFDTGIAKHSSKPDSRKAASAQIAKIPFTLARHIARCLKPVPESAHF
jgi:hypothetical protein